MKLKKIEGYFNFQRPVTSNLDDQVRNTDMSLGEASVYEAMAFGLVNGTDDAREGTRAFLEKRQPRFVGH